jgi:hypothetical protein
MKTIKQQRRNKRETEELREEKWEAESVFCAGIFKHLWRLGTEYYGCRTGPPGYIGWRNGFLGIDSWAP